MNNMDSNFTTVTGAINQVEQTLHRISDHIAVMPALNGSVGNIDASLGLLRADMHQMAEPMKILPFQEAVSKQCQA